MAITLNAYGKRQFTNWMKRLQKERFVCQNSFCEKPDTGGVVGCGLTIFLTDKELSTLVRNRKTSKVAERIASKMRRCFSGNKMDVRDFVSSVTEVVASAIDRETTECRRLSVTGEEICGIRGNTAAAVVAETLGNVVDDSYSESYCLDERSSAFIRSFNP